MVFVKVVKHAVSVLIGWVEAVLCCSMQCFSPISINKQSVPCGRCLGCKTTKRNEWVFRLKEEQIASSSSVFVTLTYSNENLVYADVPQYDGSFETLPVLFPREFGLFMKRLRKKLKSSVRFFGVGEYGDKTARPHYHLLLFNYPTDVDIVTVIQNSWPYGFSYVGTVTPKSINYVTKDILKQNWYYDIPKEFRPFRRMSKGIGKQYLVNLGKWHKADPLKRVQVVDQDGVRQRMPRYFRQKLFSKFIRDKQNAKIADYYAELGSKETLSEARGEWREAYTRTVKKSQKRGGYL